jgi:hypothetical protein
MANELVTGTVVVRVDGKSIRSKAGAKLQTGGFERTAQYADGLLIGFSQKPIAAMITCSVVDTSAANITDFNNITDSVVLFECDSGAVYTVRGAFLTKPAELSDGEGECALEFCGQPAVRTT